MPYIYKCFIFFSLGPRGVSVLEVQTTGEMGHRYYRPLLPPVEDQTVPSDNSLATATEHAKPALHRMASGSRISGRCLSSS